MRSEWREGAAMRGGRRRDRAVQNQAGQKRAGQKRAGWIFALACGVAMVLAAGAGLLRSHAQAALPLPAIDPPKSAAAPKPAQGEPGKQPAETKTESATAADRRQQETAAECADLVKMATDLKTEVDKSTKDMLSVPVVRKADEIEQLAHKVRTGTSNTEAYRAGATN